MPRPVLLVRMFVWMSVGMCATIATYFVAQELQTSDLQSHYLAEVGRQATFTLDSGTSPATRFPKDGPSDRRLGYSDLPQYLQRLTNNQFSITAQARLSPMMMKVADSGLNLPYVEKQQSGLRLIERDGKVLYESPYPKHVYPDFESVPPLVLHSLLFIENRELLSNRHPQQNPAIEWDRFGLATLELGLRKLGANIHVAGGSTLATQLEKYRHSPGGRTDSAGDKIRQMGSASLRAYLNGRDTSKARCSIALGYLNSMPLGSAPGVGEVHGLGDGLVAWFNADFQRINTLLSAENLNAGDTATAEQASAYRKVLGLLIAQRRPAFYLGRNPAALQTQIDRHLRALANQNVISPVLRDLALSDRGRLDLPPQEHPAEPFAKHKTESVLRARLAGDLGIPRLYDLDKVDLTAYTTLDFSAQQAVTNALKQLQDTDEARKAGLFGFRLLNEQTDLTPIIFSLLVYERTPQGNLLRVQADNYADPLDINDGIRLDLGSTAKMRTMVHYLELIAQLHGMYSDKPATALRKADIAARDHLSRWVIDQLLSKPSIHLDEILRAALDRRYSASPGEQFFTGGGAHHFGNFDKADDGKVMSVRDALRDSVNLVFIRLMRDLVYYHLYKPGGIARWLEADDDMHRTHYLQRFADEEGRAFLRRFYRKYQGHTAEEVMDTLVRGMRPIPKRLATAYRSIYPQQDLRAFTDFLHRHHAADALPDRTIAELFASNGPDKFNLQDRGYIAKIHPLELWLVAYMLQNPQALMEDVIKASAEQRQEVYQWLFKTNRKQAQNRRIQTLLEMEAFRETHAAWRRVGYPFETLTPSYATALGASGDRPAALAELMGILANGGTRAPAVRFNRFHFAQGTPYEAIVEATGGAPKQVLPPEVTVAAREALANVVENGTAVRLKGVYHEPSGDKIIIAGKTGTGDHRREYFSARSHVIAKQVISRTATFAFIIGDHFYGVLTAYVNGPKAANYRFTSALPTQVLKSLRPMLEPLISRAYSKPAGPRRSILAASATAAAESHAP